MTTIDKILVPIDFSPCSDNAFLYAWHLANEIKAELQVIHIVPFDTLPLEYGSMVTVSIKKHLDDSRTSMFDFLATMGKRVGVEKGLFGQVYTEIESGVPHRKIVEFARGNNIDLIVMGTQGAQSRWDRFLGSTTADLLEIAPCPIIAVPEKAKFEKQMKIGYATDFLNADPFEIWKIQKWFTAMHPEIMAVHLNETAENMIEKIESMATFFAENAPELKISFQNRTAKDMVADLNDFVALNHINLMVMYRLKQGLLKRLLFRSLTTEMVFYTKTPLLLLTEK